MPPLKTTQRKPFMKFFAALASSIMLFSCEQDGPKLSLSTFDNGYKQDETGFITREYGLRITSEDDRPIVITGIMVNDTYAAIYDSTFLFCDLFFCSDTNAQKMRMIASDSINILRAKDSNYGTKGYNIRSYYHYAAPLPPKGSMSIYKGAGNFYLCALDSVVVSATGIRSRKLMGDETILNAVIYTNFGNATFNWDKQPKANGYTDGLRNEFVNYCVALTGNTKSSQETCVCVLKNAEETYTAKQLFSMDKEPEKSKYKTWEMEAILQCNGISPSAFQPRK